MSGLLFHHFGDAPGETSAAQFAAILDRYRDRLVQPTEYAARAVSGTLRDAVVVTLDDGLRSQWEIAKPILDARGLGALWFVPTAPLIGVPLLFELDRWLWMTQAVEDALTPILRRFTRGWMAVRHPGLTLREQQYRYWRDCHPESYGRVMTSLRAPWLTDPMALCRRLWLGWGEVRTLQRTAGSHVVGNHTHSHPARICADDEALEYTTAHVLLNPPPTPLVAAYPNGRYWTGTSALLRRLGYDCAFQADAEAGETVYELPRIDSHTLAREVA